MKQNQPGDVNYLGCLALHHHIRRLSAQTELHVLYRNLRSAAVSLSAIVEHLVDVFDVLARYGAPWSERRKEKRPKLAFSCTKASCALYLQGVPTETHSQGGSERRNTS